MGGKPSHTFGVGSVVSRGTWLARLVQGATLFLFFNKDIFKILFTRGRDSKQARGGAEEGGERETPKQTPR